jgi:hypothetical protein
MIATQQQLIETFATLPPEAQRQALNFIAFLQQTYQTPVTDQQIAITSQYQELTINDLISSIPNNFTYPDDVLEFTESKPLGRELL